MGLDDKTVMDEFSIVVQRNILNQVELKQEYVSHALSIDGEGSPSLP